MSNTNERSLEESYERALSAAKKVRKERFMGEVPPLPISKYVVGELIEEKDYRDRRGLWRIYTYRANTSFSIMGRDLASLMRLGLIRIQTNKSGTISLYFGDM